MKNFWSVFFLITFFVCPIRSQDISLNYQYHLCKIVVMQVTRDWTQTGIFLKPGDSVTVIVEGFATTGAFGANPAIGWCGPEGQGGTLGPVLTSAAAHSVLGKIGNSGTSFYVGKTISFKSNVNGEFMLGYNDNYFGDNYGYYTAYIFTRFATGFIIGPSTSVQDNSSEIPTTPFLSQNYPNPFNPLTKMEYSLPIKSNVRINIYNSIGQLVRRLISEEKAPGNYAVFWNGRNDNNESMPSGSYYYQLEVGDFKESQKMILLK